MPEIINERMCAEVEGGVVVFLIGMRINRLWKVWRWLPLGQAMSRMLAELTAQPELGLLSARTAFGGRNLWMVQYWRSAAHLQSYARADSRAHLPAWTAFYKAVGQSGDVGIWHETYVVPPGHSEAIYVNMPRFGLGLVGELFPAKGRRATAGKRLAAATEPDAGAMA